MGLADKARALAGAARGEAPPSRQEIAVNATVMAKRKGGARSVRQILYRETIEWSPDFERILNLPRRQKPDLVAIATTLTNRLRRPGGTQVLRAHQGWALWEGMLYGGLLGLIQVGAGKTLIGLLMPMLLPNCKHVVLLVPASLKAQLLKKDWALYSQHWTLPNLAGDPSGKWVEGRPTLRVFSYADLSQTNATDILLNEKADTVIGDEVDMLANPEAAKTMRFLKLFERRPETRFFGWSGSVTADSIQDYAHLLALALSGGSPLPIEPSVVAKWAKVLDAGKRQQDGFVDPGVLREFCTDFESVRQGFQRRLVETPGVVATEGNLISTKLVFRERRLEVPKDVNEHLKALRRRPTDGGWTRPDGEELEDAMAVNECARQLATGFFYRWRFPREEPRELKDLWFTLRQAFNKELRGKLTQGIPYLETRLLCENAATRHYAAGCTGCERDARDLHEPRCEVAEKEPLWDSQTWPGWAAIENLVYHEQETVWLSDFMLADMKQWGEEAPGIIWIEHLALARRLARYSGFPLYEGDDKANDEIIEETGDRTVIMTMAHRYGKNLQQFNRNLVIPPSTNKHLEQLIGRTHRPGQAAEVVEVWFYLHVREFEDALERAQGKARYVFETTGGDQKLLHGTYKLH